MFLGLSNFNPYLHATLNLVPPIVLIRVLSLTTGWSCRGWAGQATPRCLLPR